MPHAFLALPTPVFFDAVGTLIYPEPSAPAVYAAVGRRFGSRLDEAVIADHFRAAFRRQDETDYANGLRTSEEREFARWRAIVRDVFADGPDEEACFQELYAHFARPDAWRCAPEAAEVLETLAARGHVLGIASNFDARLRGVAEGFPALRPVRHLIISSEIGWRKPAAGFFVEMCRQVGVATEQVLYVGDDPVNDYEGARAAGLQTVLLDPHSRSVVAPQERVTSLDDLL